MILDIAFLLCCFAFTGCGTETGSDKDPTLTEHTQGWSEWTVVKDATCTESGVSSRTCACGKKRSRQFQQQDIHMKTAFVKIAVWDL